MFVGVVCDCCACALPCLSSSMPVYCIACLPYGNRQTVFSFMAFLPLFSDIPDIPQIQFHSQGSGIWRHDILSFVSFYLFLHGIPHLGGWGMAFPSWFGCYSLPYLGQFYFPNFPNSPFHLGQGGGHLPNYLQFPHLATWLGGEFCTLIPITPTTPDTYLPATPDTQFPDWFPIGEERRDALPPPGCIT